MKTLFLMRHGESDWDATFPSDRDRPLSSRGERAAAAVGRWMRDAAQVPELVVASDALRTRRTADLAIEAGSWPSVLEMDSAIYEATPARLLDRIIRVDPARASVLLLGHEPGLSGIASRLLGGAALRFPTAAVARIDLDVPDWSRIENGCGTLAWLLPPRLLQG